jgi:hypothetical protein
MFRRVSMAARRRSLKDSFDYPNFRNALDRLHNNRRLHEHNYRLREH